MTPICPFRPRMRPTRKCRAEVPRSIEIQPQPIGWRQLPPMPVSRPRLLHPIRTWAGTTQIPLTAPIMVVATVSKVSSWPWFCVTCQCKLRTERFHQFKANRGVKDGADVSSKRSCGAKVWLQGGNWSSDGSDDGESRKCCAQNPRFASTGSMSESPLWRGPF